MATEAGTAAAGSRYTAAFNAVIAAGGSPAAALSAAFAAALGVGGVPFAPATAAEIRARTLGFKPITPEELDNAHDWVTIAPSGGNVTLDGTAFLDGEVSGTGNIAIATISGMDGQKRRVRVPATSGDRLVTVTASGTVLEGIGADGWLVRNGYTSEFEISKLPSGDVLVRWVPEAIVCFEQMPVAPASDVVTGDGADYWVVPEVLDGWVIVSVAVRVITAGTTGTSDFQIANVTAGVDVCSTKATIDSTEVSTATAATPLVINPSNRGLQGRDLLRLDVDAVSTTKPKGLIWRMELRPR